jgi:Fur family ferric uptake transcriptional regulator
MVNGKTLRKAGLKVTHPRILILDVLHEPENKHISAEEIFQLLRSNGEGIGLATVYRVLSQFEDAGILDKHNFGGYKHVFEIKNQKHHDHLVCIGSDKIIEFEDETIEKRLTEIADENDIRLVHHSLYLYGTPKENG